MAIITSRTGPAVENELNYALGRSKLIIPIVHATIEDLAFLKKFPRIFRFSPHEVPGKIEAQVAGFLKQQKLSKEKQQIVGALITIGLGLLLLSKE